jgi:hypothetical protein
MFAPDAAAALDGALARMNAAGITPQINSGFRTLADQTTLDSGGRPKASPGQSWHEVGEAIDFQLTRGTAAANTIIEIMETAGFTWGGSFTVPKPDDVHFQLSPGRSRVNGGLSSGLPDPTQVQNCENEHP